MTTDDTNNLTLVQRMAVALTSHDEQELRDITTEDIFWAVPGTGRFAGRKQGVSAIMAFAKVVRDYGVHPTVEETYISERTASRYPYTTPGLAAKRSSTVTAPSR